MPSPRLLMCLHPLASCSRQKARIRACEPNLCTTGYMAAWKTPRRLPVPPCATGFNRGAWILPLSAPPSHDENPRQLTLHLQTSRVPPSVALPFALWLSGPPWCPKFHCWRGLRPAPAKSRPRLCAESSTCGGRTMSAIYSAPVVAVGRSHMQYPTHAAGCCRGARHGFTLRGYAASCESV